MAQQLKKTTNFVGSHPFSGNRLQLLAQMDLFMKCACQLGEEHLLELVEFVWLSVWSNLSVTK